MPAMVEYIEMAASEEKKSLLREQWTEAVDQGKIHCACGQVRALVMAYRCLYCGAWFCVPCAEVHFGMTMRQWKEKKRTERRQAFECKRSQ